jgi:hypothetical protein
MKPVTILGANQLSIETENKIVFQSYDTNVCEITNFKNGCHPVVKITDNQPQSKTTAKFLNKFLQMHTHYNKYQEIEN